MNKKKKIDKIEEKELCTYNKSYYCINIEVKKAHMCLLECLYE